MHASTAVTALHHCLDRPDIVHTHDWATAPVAFGGLDGCRSVFTIHNLNYGADLIGRAMGAAAACTTVSPTYAAEVHAPSGPHLHLLSAAHAPACFFPADVMDLLGIICIHAVLL